MRAPLRGLLAALALGGALVVGCIIGPKHTDPEAGLDSAAPPADDTGAGSDRGDADDSGGFGGLDASPPSTDSGTVVDAPTSDVASDTAQEDAGSGADASEDARPDAAEAGDATDDATDDAGGLDADDDASDAGETAVSG